MGRQKRKTPDLLSEVLAGSETEEGFKETLRGCSSAKTHTNSIADHMIDHEPTLFKVAEALRACSNWLVFRHFYLAKKYRLIGGCTCKKHLVCAMCAWRRSAKTVMAYSAKINMVMTENIDLVPVLLTLTIKNGSDLAERFAHLDSAITRMIRNRSLALNGNRHKTVFRLIHGGAGSFEVKRGSGLGLWHPHFHMYALVPAGTDLLEMEWNMSEEWRKLTKDSHNVNVTEIVTSSEEKRMGAVCEVFRYALKFGEMEIVDQVAAFMVLQSKKLVRNFGSLRCKVPDDLNDTIEDELRLQPYIDLVYEYSKKKGFFLSDVTDTGDQLTSCVRPKSSGGVKNAKKLASKVFISIKDLDKPWRKRALTQEYMNDYIEQNNMEVPF